MQFENSTHLQTKSVWRAEWERILVPRFPKDKLTLDCGCGPAYYRDLFGDAYIGLDIQKCFPERGNYVRASSADLPLRDASFDFVLASALLEHIENPAETLLEICRILKKGGCILLGTPSRYGARYETLKTFRGYDIEDLERIAHDRKLLIKSRFKIGGIFAILFAEIESFLRRGLKTTKNELPSFEGEPYYNLLARSGLGKTVLKIRGLLLLLTVIIDTRFPHETLYQGACIFATRPNTNE